MSGFGKQLYFLRIALLGAILIAPSGLALSSTFSAVVPVIESLRAHNPYPSGFQESTIYQGSYLPTAVRFAPDGRYFLSEKYGRILAFDSVDDPTYTIVHDLGTQLWTFHDHGLLGLAVDPQFPTRPYLYLLYTLRGKPGGRLSRIEIDPATNQKIGNELVLMEGWCAVYPSHSAGDLHFGPDGSLYVSFGDGASFGSLDWGQDEPYNADGSPDGPCGCNDPSLEGGTLRSQDFRTSGDTLDFDGAVIRINPDTGEAMPDNPLAGGDPSDDRILAYGFRNPFRFTIHPITGDLYVCDVGWNSWEEINHVESPLTGPIPNFGWPCYEGPGPQPGYAGSNLPICDALYGDGTATPPFYTYQHTNGASATGAVVYTGSSYPSEYVGALFWADYSRGTIKVMLPDVNGNPDPGNVVTFADSEVNPVDLQQGPNGDLYFVDINLGAVKRVQYFDVNHPPVAVIDADVTTGPSPLTVQFSGLQSHDDDEGDAITFGWDFDNDGDFSDSTDIEPAMIFPSSGNYPISLKVTDLDGLYDVDTIIIAVDNGPPVATILEPLSTLTWRVGDVIDFDGQANDPDDGLMDPSTLKWRFVLMHCATPALDDCHDHTINTVFGVSSGSFTAVEHEWPTYLRVELTATEPGESGLSDTDSILLEPETVAITLDTQPTGLFASIYSASNATPWNKTAIINDVTTISAPTPQVEGDVKYTFDSWSDGGAASHNITIPENDTTFTASFDANNRPVLNPIGNKNVNEGQTLQFTVSGTDVDGTPPTFSMNHGPAGATFTNNGDGTATFEWEPGYDDQGTLANVTFFARDAADTSWTDTEIIAITVANVNPPPVITGISNKTVDENVLLQFGVTASDPDGSIPSLSVENLPAGASFVDNGDGTGSFSWKPGFNDAGQYTMTFVATDADSPALEDTDNVTVTVSNVNRAPVLSSIGNKTVDEKELLEFTVSANDPDGSDPSLSASNTPSGATFDDHGDGTGTFSWTPNYSQSGTYSNIQVTATDGDLSDTESFSITVNNVNRAPSLTPIANQTVDENEVLQIAITSEDADGPAPDLTASNLPDGAVFTDNENGTGTLVWQTDYSDAGVYQNITITATDSEFPSATDEEAFQITVNDVNRIPIIDDVANVTVSENDLVAFTVTASDPDGTPVTLVATNLPDGATFTDHGDGTGTFHWQTDYNGANLSPYVVGFSASDGDKSDIESCVITVNDVNRPTILDPIGDKSVVEGELLTFNVTGSDPDGELEIIALNLPPGAMLLPVQNGEVTFHWTPDYNAANNSPYHVTFKATDSLSEDEETVQITVTNGAAPGSITVVRPKGGITHEIGAGNILVKWKSSGDVGNKVIIELWRKGVYVQKLKVTRNDGKFRWKPGEETSKGKGYSIRVRSKDNPLIVGESGGTFTITKPKK